MFAGGINPATTLRPGSNWLVEHAFARRGSLTNWHGESALNRWSGKPDDNAARAIPANIAKGICDRNARVHHARSHQPCDRDGRGP